MFKRNEVLVQHKQNLASARKIIVSLIEKLQDIADSDKYSDEFPNEWKYVWGEKENVVSALTKLIGLLVKVLPMEQSIMELETELQLGQPKGRVLTSDDKDVIRRYIKKFQENIPQ